jgi:hypothetical protein
VLRRVFENSVLRRVFENSVLRRVFENSVLRRVFEKSVLRRVFENSVLRRIFRSKRQVWGQKCKTKSFIICTLRRILLGLSIEGYDGRGM